MAEKPTTRPESIDAYLATLEGEKRAALEALRKTIQAAAPEAEECISYQLPAFRFEGRILETFGAASKHRAFYPSNATTVEAFKEDLMGYDTSKATIRFTPERPLPVDLMRRLVLARIEENRNR